MTSTNSIGVSTPTSQNTPARILFTLAFLAIMLTVVAQLTTQYLAAQFGYSAQLGQPLWQDWYSPWHWLEWSYTYRRTHTGIIDTGLFIFVTGMALVLVGFAFVRVLIHRSSKGVANLHGSADWANRDSMVKAGLLPAKPGAPHPGAYVGGWYNPKLKQTEYLRHNGPEHILAFAPTRSGKGVGLVLPTLLSWPHSCLVYDIKGENWALTAGWRQQHANNVVLKFDPTATDGSCARFNPLAEIRIGEADEIRDAQNIAGMIVDPDGKGLDDHWSKTAYDLLTALLLHICYTSRSTGKSANLGDIETVLTAIDPTDEEADVSAIFREMAQFPHLDGQPHDLIKTTAQKMLTTPEKERGSIISSTLSFLSLYKDPVVKANVSKSHWKITDLMNHDKPVSLFLVVNPSDAQRLRPLIRLMVSMIVNRLTESMEFKDGSSVAGYKHRLLLLLDEFASLKRMNAVEDALSYAAGYGLKFYLIVQDLQQIIKQYSREEGLTGNCHVRIAYAPNKIDTAELLSKMAGTTTVIKESITTSGKRHSWFLTSSSITTNEVQRPIMTPDEVMRLPGMEKKPDGSVVRAGDMLIFSAGFAPIYGRQILYFLDPVFITRAKVPAPASSDQDLCKLAAPAPSVSEQSDSIADPDIEKLFKEQEAIATAPESSESLALDLKEEPGEQEP